MQLPMELEPVKFHRYRSYVKDRILYMDFNNENQLLRKELISLFNFNKIKCSDDNKIVFECQIAGTTICYGFYNLKFSIGLSYYDENEERYGKK